MNDSVEERYGGGCWYSGQRDVDAKSSGGQQGGPGMEEWQGASGHIVYAINLELGREGPWVIEEDISSILRGSGYYFPSNWIG